MLFVVSQSRIIEWSAGPRGTRRPSFIYVNPARGTFSPRREVFLAPVDQANFAYFEDTQPVFPL